MGQSVEGNENWIGKDGRKLGREATKGVTGEYKGNRQII